MTRASTIAMLSLALPASFALWAAGCSSPDVNARVDPGMPSVTQFAFVAPVLERRCGSIDCHGSSFRNMRVYGYGGTRLGPSATTPESPMSLTAEEIQATYESVIGLEPEIMRAVAQSGGAGPERLTFVRKGRGDEDHKGDRRITPGDNSDLCITTWLGGQVNEAACRSGGCIETPDAGGADASADAGTPRLTIGDCN